MKFAGSAVLVALLSRTTNGFVTSPGRSTWHNSGPTGKGPSSTSFAPTTTSSSSTTSLNAVPIDTARLGTYFLEKVIETGVPTVAFCAAAAFVAKAFSKRDNEATDILKNNAVGSLYNDLYGDGSVEKKGGGLLGKLGMGRGANNGINLGIPSEEYIEITNLNSKLNSYQYSMTSATQSKAKAAAKMRSTNFDKALQLGLDSSISELSPSTKSKLVDIEKEFLKKGALLVARIQRAQAVLVETAIDKEMKASGNKLDTIDPQEKRDTKEGEPKKMLKMPGMKDEAKAKVWKELGSAQNALMQLETAFVRGVLKELGPSRANGIRTALLGDVAARGTGGLLAQLEERPLSSLLNHNDETRPKSLFVMKFPGDVSASQVNDLREEVTAIVRNAQPGDEALVVLESGGGTVTGYGLAAGQLQRFKDKGMKLTCAVEQVAASGGYMMCCVADKIVASPFAVLGSIGVISDIPNAYERLKKEGIEFQTVTAGKFKRTITPTKKVTQEDYKKTKQDIEEIFQLFKKYVGQNRPSLDIDDVATGETWFGTDALEKGLCDEIKTADDLLMEYVDQGYNVYQVQYKPPKKQDEALLGLVGASTSDGLGQRLVKWAVRTVAKEVKSEFNDIASEQQSVKRRYMMLDDTKENIRAQD